MIRVAIFVYLINVTQFSCTCRMSFFFFNDTATTEIYTLSLHDALPISSKELEMTRNSSILSGEGSTAGRLAKRSLDRKSTRLNSSHANISYAVFCLKKKKRLS